MGWEDDHKWRVVKDLEGGDRCVCAVLSLHFLEMRIILGLPVTRLRFEADTFPIQI
jgi:hypothetical protein